MSSGWVISGRDARGHVRVAVSFDDETVAVTAGVDGPGVRTSPTLGIACHR